MFEIPEHIILSQGTKINILFEHLFCYFLVLMYLSIKLTIQNRETYAKMDNRPISGTLIGMESR
nr:MAG TPA: hypothetical protein [Caudoviricetes sp.]DAZ19658.1 MAG TPA: hypothetical protein [Caudoviricetes sp.]